MKKTVNISECVLNDEQINSLIKKQLKNCDKSLINKIWEIVKKETINKDEPVSEMSDRSFFLKKVRLIYLVGYGVALHHFNHLLKEALSKDETNDRNTYNSNHH